MALFPTCERLSGSSPLARGLQDVLVEPLPSGGIIPARAVFTSKGRKSGCTVADHPRSRGVYPACPRCSASTRGSSPLARGLQAEVARGPLAPRIIPARAGFTRAGGDWSVLIGDHPRSRGVYVSSSGRRRAPRGSSPLARGLRPRPPRRACARRIIPARAGFTLGCGCVWAGWRDHPRSRGVYRRAPPTPKPKAGSSPLARGLLGDDRPAWERARIIPARAGFTRRDHHRRERGHGSSPLARGLPAGTITAESGVMDHPRSRGVYDDPVPVHPSARGSSPLARGLPAVVGVEPDGPGIIPARAGFTSSRRHTGPCAWDHPRSRGVYIGWGSDFASTMGSSPLARGLRWRLRNAVTTKGIIPARAGFTLDRQVALPIPEDHPRSRGVYEVHVPLAAVVGGSSPLARGLRGQARRRAARPGIIPARAGFTRP